ncbi:MAG: acyltransferase [Bacteroidales bacterium]|jgi:phenylacetate-coenzyme A ligase PaaK-like adenylate-forming protein|nr:acyltransferase [Bacteroidales bacterium]
MNPGFISTVFNIKSQEEFRKIALEVFRYQAFANPVYREFTECLGIDPARVDDLTKIPFLPVSMFRNHRVISGNREEELCFESSGTTGQAVSRHYVCDRSVYEESFLRGFRYFYGEPSGYLITALLPSYTERKNSSLVYMMNSLIRQSGDSRSGFYRDNTGELLSCLAGAAAEGKKSMLVGVSFALLDLAADMEADLSQTIVVETGGMKGRRKEITRSELHEILIQRFNLGSVHSEYGMTELLSQAWSKGNGIFNAPPWMKIIIRDPQDPLTIMDESGRTGGINIIDLANIYSCSFLSTGDLGRVKSDGSFEVSGRFDESDIRGCNLLAVSASP